MQISESPALEGTIIQKISERMQYDRKVGTHVSELIGCLRKAWARRNGMMPGETPDETLLFSLGRAMQDYLTGKPSEEGEVVVEVDGVIGSIDNMNLLYPDLDQPEEFKATYASAGRDVLDTDHYFDQLAAYCYMMGKTKGNLIVFYVNGYYNFQRKKDNQVGGRNVLKVFDVEYGAAELNDFWKELLRRKEILEHATSLEDIDLFYHRTWECNFCPLAGTACPGGIGGYENRWVKNANDPE